MEIKISAGLYKLTKDNEGEITLVFKIPQTDANKSLEIPELKTLELKVAWDA